jgi:hypothetical protein
MDISFDVRIVITCRIFYPSKRNHNSLKCGRFDTDINTADPR